MKSIVPGFYGPEHGIEDGQEHTHASDDDDLLGLSSGEESIVEALDGVVEADGGQRRHAESAAYLPAPAEDGTLAAHLARIAIEGRHADQRGDCPARQPSQFLYFRDQAGGSGRSDTAHAGQPLSKIGVMSSDVAGQLGLDLADLWAIPSVMASMFFLAAAWLTGNR